MNHGPIESILGNIKIREVLLNKYEPFEELVKDIEDYIHFYNHNRIQKHSRQP